MLVEPLYFNGEALGVVAWVAMESGEDHVEAPETLRLWALPGSLGEGVLLLGVVGRYCW